MSSTPLSYPPREIAINGIYLYITNNDGLLILNVSDPSHPVEIGSYQSPGCTFDLAISNGFVYIADCSYGLRIIDASNPSNPVEVAVFQTPEDVVTVDVQGNYVFLPMHGGGFMVLDVSDPSQPKEVGNYPTPGHPIANEIIVRGDYAYVSEGAAAVRIYDISDPAMPYEVSLTGIDGLGGMTIQDQYLYVSTYEGVLTLDISDTEPRQVGFCQVPELILDISISGNLIWVTEFQNGVGLLRLLREKEAAVISPMGGYLDAASGTASFDVPAGTFTDTVQLTYHHLFYDEPSADLFGIGRTFELTALYSGTDNDAPIAQDQVITMTLNYPEAELGPVTEDTLALYSWDGSTWVRETSSQLNTQDNQISATVNHLGLWAILGPTDLQGDLNQDGTLNALDFLLCVNVFIGVERRPEIVSRADLNANGTVNFEDVQEILNILLGYQRSIRSAL